MVCRKEYGPQQRKQQVDESEKKRQQPLKRNKSEMIKSFLIGR